MPAVGKARQVSFNVSDTLVGLGLGFLASFIAYVFCSPWFSHEQCPTPSYAHVQEQRDRRAAMLLNAVHHQPFDVEG